MLNCLRFFTVLAVALLASCTLPGELELFNNTSFQVTVITDRESHTVEPGQTATITSFEYTQVKIAIGDITKDYGVVELPSWYFQFVGWGPFTRRELQAQLEPDGKIWGVESDQEFPVSEFRSQPKGFPLEPITA